MDVNDQAALVGFFDRRNDSNTEAMRAYWAGRIDGHCLQNAIGLGELAELANDEGFAIDWTSMLS